MPRDHEPHGDDRGRLRLILAVPVVILTLLSCYFCWWAVTIRPQGEWDEPAHRGVALSCFLTVAFGVALLGLWLPRPLRRLVGWTWIAPGVVLAAVAAARWAIAP
ncbi:hypothetical protein ABT127_33175 [Streptomyces sp. NPDC001904]|uniref:hypothetical protein n=1 Tax=Streptomyces sp. NPDC001904 TaxID=3154531 RepID=UPI00332D9087